MTNKTIKSALLSVYSKEGLSEIVTKLVENNVALFSTGGTLEFIRSLGFEATAVEELTGYPSILGGRVKTLHPGVFGGILARRGTDETTLAEYGIPEIDLVIVDLYPFEDTVSSGAGEAEIIEKIDIGGISLIRAAAKNFRDVVVVGSQAQYGELLEILKKGPATTLEQRRSFATKAFGVTSHYDTAIHNWFSGGGCSRSEPGYAENCAEHSLRYGENPHQKASFRGDLNAVFEQLHGKDISYNNLLDIDAAVNLIKEFDDTTFAILKHNNACGVGTGSTVRQAYERALAGDPVSAFGGVLISNRAIDAAAAEVIGELFFEVILAPEYSNEALEILYAKKNRIVLVLKDFARPATQTRSLLNGVAVQQRDTKVGGVDGETRTVTHRKPTAAELRDLVFANKIVKQSKSNAIVLARDGQLLASGVGQTSRVDALRQAIDKARSFGFDLRGAVLASDAFFPFADCVEIAHGAGVEAIVQPGGSVRDADSVDFCDANDMTMIFTGLRHFKH